MLIPVIFILILLILIICIPYVVHGSREKIIREIITHVNKYTDIEYTIGASCPNVPSDIIKYNVSNPDIYVIYYDDCDIAINEMCGVSKEKQHIYSEFKPYNNGTISTYQRARAYPLHLELTTADINNIPNDLPLLCKKYTTKRRDMPAYSQILYKYYSRLMPQLTIADTFFNDTGYMIDETLNVLLVYGEYTDAIHAVIINKSYMTICIIDYIIYNEHDLSNASEIYNGLSQTHDMFYVSHECALKNNLQYITVYANISDDLMRDQIHNPLSMAVYVYGVPTDITYGLARANIFDDIDIQLKYMEYAGGMDTTHIKHMIEYFKSDQHILTWIVMNVPVTRTTYTKKSYKIASQIANMLQGCNIKPTSYLDIGTIDAGQLRAISKRLSINHAHGINIDEGEGHLSYDTFDDVDTNITIYDGVNIPIINNVKQYDLISIFSVLHHIPQDSLDLLIKSIADKCSIGGHLIIKDNDLTNEHAITYFRWQHYIYSRKLNNVSLTRTDMTLASVKKMLAPYFKLVKCDLNKKYVRTYFAIFERIEV